MSYINPFSTQPAVREATFEIDLNGADVREWARRVDTPALLLDLGVFKRRLALLMDRSQYKVMFALKSNPHLALLQAVLDAGGGFDVASAGELRLVKDLGVPGERIYCSSIAKSKDEIKLANEMTVRRLAADSHLELEKIQENYPGANVLIRMLIHEPSAGVALSNRFGVDGKQLRELVQYGRLLGLKIEGISVHVGSQCMSLAAWAAAVNKLIPFLDPMMSCVSLGGGFPIAYKTFSQVPSLTEIVASIAPAAELLIKSGLDVLIEPGRVLTGPVGTMVTSVNLVKPSEGNRKWLFLDAGAYNSLQIIREGFDFEIRPLDGSRQLQEYNICGPSCHSRDTFSESIVIPEQVLGDRLLIVNAGAYTIPFASPFCGNSPPRVEIIESGEPDTYWQSTLPFIDRSTAKPYPYPATQARRRE